MATNKIILHKNFLTQSEKHRLFCEGAEDTSRGRITAYTRVWDCPQNAVISRKFSNDCEILDRNKTKTASRINSEKHILSLKHKELLAKQKKVKLQDEFNEKYAIETIPGFRYKRNGDMRRNVQCVAPASSTPKRNPSLRQCPPNKCISDLSTSVSGHPGGGDSRPIPETHDIMLGVNEEIQKIEDELKDIRNSRELLLINKRMSDVRSSLVFLRAHSNDHHVHEDDKVVLPRSMMSNNTKSNTSHRFDRNCYRSGCVACEFRLKHERVKYTQPTNTHKKRWVTPPTGVYVKHVDASEREMQIRSAYNSKTSAYTSKSSLKGPIVYSQSSPEMRKKINKAKKITPDVKFSSHQPSSRKNSPQETGTATASPKNSRCMRSQSSKTTVDKGLKKNSTLGISSSDHHLLDAKHKSSNTRSNDKQSVLEVIRSRLKIDQEEIETKVSRFLSDVPDAKPCIERWRESSGMPRKWRDEYYTNNLGPGSTTDLKKNDSDMTWGQYKQAMQNESQTEADQLQNSSATRHGSEMAWSQYQKNNSIGDNINRHTQSDMFHHRYTRPTMSNKLSEKTLEKDSYEELVKCRYLRVPKSIMKQYDYEDEETSL